MKMSYDPTTRSGFNRPDSSLQFGDHRMDEHVSNFTLIFLFELYCALDKNGTKGKGEHVAVNTTRTSSLRVRYVGKLEFYIPHK